MQCGERVRRRRCSSPRPRWPGSPAGGAPGGRQPRVDGRTERRARKQTGDRRWRSLPAGRALQLAMTKARHEVIVHHADRLHEGIADGGSDESKPALHEAFAHRVRLPAAGGEVAQGAAAILLGHATDEAPEKGTELAFFLLELKERARVADGRHHLLAIPDDARILQELPDLTAVVAGHAIRVEPVERLEKARAFVEDHAPREPGLEAIQDELREEVAIVVERHAPLFVVVGEHQRVVVAGPAALDHYSRILHGAGSPG